MWCQPRNAWPCSAVVQRVTTGQWVLLLAVAAAVAFGLWRAWSDGRFRGTHPVHGSGGGGPAATGDVVDGAPSPVLAGTPYADRLGERATFVQFSSAFCAPCRATRRVLEDVAGVVPGVVHLEIDAESHLDLVRRLGIMRTPTTVVLDEDGLEVTRASGTPTKPQVLAALGEAVED